jgi:hypothetical protein
MIWGKKKSDKEEEKLRKPQAIPELVQKHLVAQCKLPAHLAPLLKAVIRKSGAGETASDIRVFDESEALARKVQVNDYATLDEHHDLILYEGRFNQTSKQVELQEKTKVNWDTPIFTEAEIRQKIEALSQPGSTVFFYMARGSNHGGPLGMGASVIELNPGHAEKQGKKYNIYFADVVDMQPADKGQKVFDSNKSKDVASWVKNGHDKRAY